MSSLTTLVQLSMRINDNCGIFEAEASAIVQALDMCQSRDLRSCLIASDSLNVLNSLQNCDPRGDKHPLIYKILQTTKRINCKIKFVWVPAHRGLYGNERADMLAKAALLLDPRDNMHCFYWNIYSKFKFFAINESMLYYENIAITENKGRRYFSLLRESYADRIRVEPWFRACPLPP